MKAEFNKTQPVVPAKKDEKPAKKDEKSAKKDEKSAKRPAKSSVSGMTEAEERELLGEPEVKVSTIIM